MNKRSISILALASLVALQATGVSAYTVRQGDTLSSIAARFGTTYRALAERNGIPDPDLIRPGQEIATGASPSDPVLGALPAGRVIPDVKAGYVDSLATRITADATSFTLVNGTDGQNRSLSGTYGFTFEEGTTNKEYVIATCSGTSCAFNTRGIDLEDGTTSVSSLKKEHRRAAEVKITDYPLLAIMKRMLNGETGASSTFMLGDGTAALNKTLKASNGSANLPFLRYNEASDRWEFSDDGVSTVTFATSSAAGLSASTTKGVFVTASQIGVSASSTGSVAFDTLGRLYVNPAFNLPATFATSVTFSGPTTFAGGISASWPSASSSIATAGYADSKFYGDASDGDLTISSGTTTLNTAGKTAYQYGNVSITGTGALTFGSNLQGKPISIYVNGNLTVTSTQPSGAVNADGLGVAPGGVDPLAVDSTSYAGGDGGNTRSGAGGGGGGGGGGGANLTASAGTTPGGSATAGTAGPSFFVPTNSGVPVRVQLMRPFIGRPGGNGGQGWTGSQTTCAAAAGGNGGGSVTFFVKGNVNVSSVFSAKGANGANAAAPSPGDSGCGGGGGGGGGWFGIFYGGTLANTATFTLSPGLGGTSSTGSSYSGGLGGRGATGTSAVLKINNPSWLY